ncbi:MAG: metal-sulfur cluster assembly factor [Candidatus Pacebacteria bacterium]|nr:metal-sulfur cluster assembly factor [Candidatus Paceibacterota bacterium]
MELNVDNIYKQLSTVIDPETGLDLVSMGLFYKVEIKDNQIYIKMTLTSPGCPLIEVLDDMIRSSLEVFEEVSSGKGINIDLTFDPPWTPDMMSEEAKAELGID